MTAPTLSRRHIVVMSVAAGAGFSLAGPHILAAEPAAAAAGKPITKAIPSTGEKLPVIGLGTNAYSVSAPEDLAQRREVLAAMPQLGGSIIDTAPSYGSSESVLGELIANIGNRDKLFIATKVTAPNDNVQEGTAMLEESFRRLRVKKIDLMQVHSLNGVNAILPVLLEWKKQGRIRYVGVTTSNDRLYPGMLEAMKKYPLDFIQVDYSIANRSAADELLPLAQERKIAVLANLPLGGRNGSLFTRVANKPLPPWAGEIDAQSWGQVFLKYVVSHPAVTAAIPGTTRLKNMEDNQAAGRGRLPDAALRKRMEEYWDALS